MTRAESDAIRVEAFYHRWKVPVYRFCCVFLGDEGAASESTACAFFEYVRQGGPIELAEMPPALLGMAVAAVQERRRVVAKPNGKALNLTDVVLTLPCEQRAVFILRSVLGLSVETISEAIGLSNNSIRSQWFQAVLRLRELLPRKFFEECCQ